MGQYAPSRARLNGIFFFTASKKTSRHLIGSRTSCRPTRSVIILVMKQSGLPLRGRPILFTTRMITDRIGLHSVPLPLLIERSVTSRYHGSKIFWMTTIGRFCNGDGEQQTKSLGLDWPKNNFARASRFFVHFLAFVARLRHETSQFHSPALWIR